MFLLVFLLVSWFCCLRLIMTQFCIEMALLMISCMWFSWLSLNREIHPYPNNSSFYSLLMARVRCVSWFHNCHELGYFDFDGSHGCHQNMWDVHTQATSLSLMLWWLGLDVSHASIAIMILVFYCLHLASLGKQTRPPLFCSICYFSSATSDRYQNVLNHDIVWGHILFLAYDAIDEYLRHFYSCLWCLLHTYHVYSNGLFLEFSYHFN
jgi:hypothetical protein